MNALAEHISFSVHPSVNKLIANKEGMDFHYGPYPRTYHLGQCLLFILENYNKPNPNIL